MIQRPQSILLFGAIITIVLSFVFPLWVSGSGEVQYFLTAWETGQFLADGSKEVIQANFHVMGLGLVLIVALFFTVFKYKKRLLQMKMCALSSILTSLYAIIILVLAIPEAQELAKVQGNTNWSAYLPLVTFLLIWLSRFLIYKDEKLVRSVDRMR